MPVGICYCAELGTLNADSGTGKRSVLMIRNCSCQYNISLLSMTSKGGKGDKKRNDYCFHISVLSYVLKCFGGQR